MDSGPPALFWRVQVVEGLRLVPLRRPFTSDVGRVRAGKSLPQGQAIAGAGPPVPPVPPSVPLLLSPQPASTPIRISASTRRSQGFEISNQVPNLSRSQLRGVAVPDVAAALAEAIGQGRGAAVVHVGRARGQAVE